MIKEKDKMIPTFLESLMNNFKIKKNISVNIIVIKLGIII